MVNSKSFFLWIVLVLVPLGCAQRDSGVQKEGSSQREITYAQACKLFHVGMSPAEVEKVYGKPESQDELGDFILWEYPPLERVKSTGNTEEFRGFQIAFRNNKTTKIEATWAVYKHRAGN